MVVCFQLVNERVKPLSIWAKGRCRQGRNSWISGCRSLVEETAESVEADHVDGFQRYLVNGDTLQGRWQAGQRGLLTLVDGMMQRIASAFCGKYGVDAR